MIQRIQSIYLFLAATAGFGVLAVPFARTEGSAQDSGLFADTVFSVQDNLGLLVLFVLAGLLSLGAIFLFKNRPLQIKTGWVALIADVLGLLLAGILFWQDSSKIGSAAVESGIGAFLPVLFLIFAFLGIRAIKKDESLVRSADRLR